MCKRFLMITILFEAGDAIEVAYFPTSAIISLVVGLSTGEMIEAAMVGRRWWSEQPVPSMERFR